MRIPTYHEVTRIPELPERVKFSGPWKITRKPALSFVLLRNSQDPVEETTPAQTYFTRMDEIGMIYIWRPDDNTLRCI
jgi:hypothetical protein